jgi:hypothetical protein
MLVVMPAMLLAIVRFRAQLAFALVALSAACAAEPVPGNPPPPAECPLSEDSRFTFTAVAPAASMPSPFCRDIDPAELNRQADAGTQVCDISQKDGCRADVACQVMGFDVKGEVAALEDGIFGVFDVFVEGLGKVCSYAVEATVK